MKKNIISSLLLAITILNVSAIPAFAMPNLDGLSNTEKIQVIDNHISVSMENIEGLEKDITQNEETLIKKKQELYSLQKEYQVQKKNSNYDSSSFLRTSSSQGSNDDLKLLELILNSNSFSDLFKKIELSKTTKFKQSKLTQVLEKKEDYLLDLQEKLKEEQLKLEDDKENLTDEKAKLEELKKTIEEEIARQPKVILQSNVTPPPISQEASEKAKSVINEAFKYLGTPYVWGGTSPSGFDCSGLTQYVFANNGVSLPRISESQQTFGTPINISDVKPGDLLFYGYPAYHVSIYIGDGQYIHAPQTGDVVKISTVNWSSVSSATRVIN